MPRKDNEPVYVDGAGISYWQGTAKNPFNARALPLVMRPAEIEHAFLHGDREIAFKAAVIKVLPYLGRLGVSGMPAAETPAQDSGRQAH